MSAPLLRSAQRCLAQTHRISPLCRHAAQAAAVTFTYRAPKTLSALQTRGYFWQKAAVTPVAGSNATGANTTVTTVKEVPDATPNAEQAAAEAQAAESARLNTKSGRLVGFSFTEALDRALSSWPHVKTYLVWASVGVGILFVFKGGLNVIEFFGQLNFLDVGEVAFLAGLLSGVGAVACGWMGTRFLRLRPEPIFQHALKRINSDATVHAYMGQQVSPSNFRAYSFVNGSLRMTQEQRDKAAQQQGMYKYWQPKRLQLFFQVSGSNGSIGMVTAEVEKTWKGDHTYNLLSIDLDRNGERIVLEGDVAYRINQGIIKLR